MLCETGAKGWVGRGEVAHARAAAAAPPTRSKGDCGRRGGWEAATQLLRQLRTAQQRLVAVTVSHGVWGRRAEWGTRQRQLQRGRNERRQTEAEAELGERAHSG